MGNRYYLSGPMSGLPGCNYEAFAEAALALRLSGCENIVSPHEIRPLVAAPTWEDHMRADLSALLECDTIVLLPGWQSSRGARLELTVATALGFAVACYQGSL